MFRCRFCGKTVNSFEELFFHIKRECKNVPKTRKCPVCGARFRSIRLFKVHLINSIAKDVQHRNFVLS